MQKSYKITVGIVVLIVVVIFLSTSNNKTPTGPIKIGVSTMLTGDWAALGNNIVNAAKLAVTDINDSGGINGRKIELTIEDSGLDSKSGLSAAQKLIDVDGIRYVIGGTSSNGTMAAAPIANQSHSIYMTPVTGGSNIDNAGEYIFRTANSDLLAGHDLAEAALGLGYKKIVTITEVTEYTIDIDKSFEAIINGGNNPIVLSEQFQPGTTDFRTIVAKVRAVNPDAILVLSQTGTGGAYFIKQARQAGISAHILTDFTFIANGDTKKILSSFEGIYFADPAYNVNSTTSKTFFARYKEKYATDSLIPFHAASTYDSIMMLADALRAVGDNSQKVHDWLLTNIKNWTGLMGTYSLDDKGNSNLGFIIKVIKNGNGVPVTY